MLAILNSLESITSNLLMGFDLSFIGDFLLELAIKFSMLLLGFVEKFLILIFDIAGISFFSDSTIGEFTTRVYIILGVLMLFKITISCIQYLINPDKAEDKESGFGGILKRTLISIILLALVPSIFTFAKEAQVAISEALPKIILGREKGIDTKSIASDIAYTTALGFFNYKDESCNNGSIGGLANASNPKFSSVQDISQNADIIATEQCNGQDRYDFNWFFCILTGLFLIFIVISMVIDVGIRTIKFGFLELIAPIPIASYIDPKSSKKSFDSWVHNTVTVYVDLFIRLGVIYFILYLFEIFFGSFNLSYEIPNEGNIGVSRSMLVNAAIIIALFMFAKNAPKFICDILGIKMDGDGSIAGMFKRTGGLAGAGLGAMKTGLSNYKTQRNRLTGKGVKGVRNVAESLKSAIAGAGSALGRGTFASVSGKKGFGDVYKSSFSGAVKARDARNERVDNLYVPKRNADGSINENAYGHGDYLRDRVNTRLGIPSDQGFIKQRYDVMEKIGKTAADAKLHGVGKMNETPDRYSVSMFKMENGRRVAIDGYASVIYNELGREDISMEEIRRLYSQIQNGVEITHRDGSKRRASDALATAIGQMVQTVEKRTSYLKEAELMGTGDPASTTYLNKLLLEIQSNSSLFTAPEIMTEITKKFSKYGFANVTDVGSLTAILKQLGNINAGPKPSKPDDYDTNPTAKAAYDSAIEAYEQRYFQIVDEHANIINAVKDAFEEVTKQQFNAAQAADFRAKKTQEAIQNDKK